MKLKIESKIGILDRRFLQHLISAFPIFLNFNCDKKKLRNMEKYLQENVLRGRIKYSFNQVIVVILRNIIFSTDNHTAIIQIDSSAVFPYTNVKVKDVASFIDDGNLDINGTNVFHNLFEYIKDNIEDLRNKYEMGMI